MAASEDPPRSLARCVAGRVEGGSHDEVPCPEPVEDDLPVGPAARGLRSPSTPGTPLSGPSLYIHWKSASSPLSTSPIHSVFTEPYAGPGRAGSRAASAPFCGVDVERGGEPGERGKAAVDPLAIDGDEELFGNGQLGEVRGQPHRAHALGGPGRIDGVQRDAQAGARGVDADGSAGVGIVRDGRHRLRRVGEAVVRPSSTRAAGQEEGQRHARGRPARRAAVPPNASGWRDAASEDTT